VRGCHAAQLQELCSSFLQNVGSVITLTVVLVINSAPSKSAQLNAVRRNNAAAQPPTAAVALRGWIYLASVTDSSARARYRCM
jgi:hypothetical protein